MFGIFRLILLNKLLEDGNVLYRKSRLTEAAHRYQYALKKFPADDQGEHNLAFHQLQINFLLNFSRCKRKLNVSFQSFLGFPATSFWLQEPEEAIELANEALAMKPDSYEAYYALAKAKLDLDEFECALRDVQEAQKLSPSQNVEVKKVLAFLQEEIVNKMSPGNRLLHRNHAISVDTLHQ